ncbi:MAG TPA: MFS transporter [Streptosporangiaceae bacterium]|nr:MFS transporter [Streptosporangiaceae bacterium]
MPRLNPAHFVRSLVPQSRNERVYLLAVLINVYGTGLIITAMTLYAIKVVHLTATRSGLALTIAGLVGLLAAMPMGRLADRRGPRDVARLALLLLGVAAASYVFLAHSFVSYLLVAIVDGSALSASNTASVALLRRVGGNNATTFRSQASAVLNLGISLGVATAGAAIEINTPNAYRALFLGNALSCLIGVAVLSLLPKYEPLPGAHEESPLAALKDKPFVAYTVLSGGMYMQYLVLNLLLPVWIVFHTNAPRWSVSAFVVINTAIVVLFQVRVGKTVQTVGQGGAAFLRAGVIFLVTCSAMGLAAGLPAWGALLLLAGAIVLHTYGELWHASGMFALDFGLAPAHAQGQYQGLVGMGNFAGQALSPLVLVGLVLSAGRLGFVLLGAWFVLLGLAAPAVARWGERTRPAVPAAEAEAEAAGPDAIIAEAAAERAIITDLCLVTTGARRGR